LLLCGAVGVAVSIAPSVAMERDALADVAGDSNPQGGSSSFSFHVPPQRVVDLLAEFDAHAAAKRWPRAFESLSAFAEQAQGMLIREGEVMLPADDALAARLIALPADGVEAFRVFHDAKVAALLREADDAAARGDIAGETALLQQIATQFPVATGADLAMDRLAAAAFEAGDASGAAAMWQQVLTAFPQPSISRADLHLRRGLALSRSGDRQPLQQLIADLDKLPAAQRQGRLAGKAVDVRAALLAATTAPETRDAPPAAPRELVGVEMRWQSRYRVPAAKEKKATDDLPSVHGNDFGQRSTVDVTQLLIPAVASDEARVFISWFGQCAAIDQRTGKLIWRMDQKQYLERPDQRNWQAYMGSMLLVHRDEIAAGQGLVFTTAVRPATDAEQLRTELVALHAATGRVRWRSSQQLDEARCVLSQPIVDGGRVYVVMDATDNQLSLVAFELASGKLAFRLPLGMAMVQSDWAGSNYMPVALGHIDNRLYIATNSGAALVVDVRQQRVVRGRWLDNPLASQGGQRLIYNREVDNGRRFALSRGAMLVHPDGIYLREYGSREMISLNPATLEARWTRRLGNGEYPVEVNSQRIVTWQDGPLSYASDTRKLQWSRRSPSRAGDNRPAIAGDLVASFDVQGLKFHRLSDGEMVYSTPGEDATGAGGRVVMVGDLLLTLSPQAVTAYELQWKTPAEEIQP
jgi:hypothetical protein